MFILLSAAGVTIYILMHPFLVQATVAHLPSSATPEEREIVATTLRSELMLRCAFLPIRLLVGWSSFAVLLYALCRAFTPPKPIRFNRIFSLEVHAEATNLLAQLATLSYLILRSEGAPNATSLVPFSIAMIVRPDTFTMFSLLNSLNFFTLLYIAFLTMGISIQSGFSRGKSLLIVFVTWSVSVLFNVGVLELMQDVMHLIV